MKTFVPLTEHNDWEGETWVFWLQVEGNEDALVEMFEMISEADYDYDEGYELDLGDRADEAFVTKTVDDSRIGYMAYDSMFEGKLILPNDRLADVREALDEWLYKGKIEKWFTNG